MLFLLLNVTGSFISVLGKLLSGAWSQEWPDTQKWKKYPDHRRATCILLTHRLQIRCNIRSLTLNSAWSTFYNFYNLMMRAFQVFLMWRWFTFNLKYIYRCLFSNLRKKEKVPLGPITSLDLHRPCSTTVWPLRKFAFTSAALPGGLRWTS